MWYQASLCTWTDINAQLVSQTGYCLPITCILFKNTTCVTQAVACQIRFRFWKQGCCSLQIQFSPKTAAHMHGHMPQVDRFFERHMHIPSATSKSHCSVKRLTSGNHYVRADAHSLNLSWTPELAMCGESQCKENIKKVCWGWTLLLGLGTFCPKCTQSKRTHVSDVLAESFCACWAKSKHIYSLC